MKTPDVRVRPARPEDDVALRAVVTAAFEAEAEALLVDALVRDGDAEIGLVAEAEGAILGHVLLSRMQAPFAALALAPVSVAPPRQGQGVGSILVCSAIETARQADSAAIFVLGAPADYGRFGFAAATAARVASPYAGPYFQAVILSSRPPRLEGALRHAPAFARMEARSASPEPGGRQGD